MGKWLPLLLAWRSMMLPTLRLPRWWSMWKNLREVSGMAEGLRLHLRGALWTWTVSVVQAWGYLIFVRGCLVGARLCRIVL